MTDNNLFAKVGLAIVGVGGLGLLVKKLLFSDDKQEEAVPLKAPLSLEVTKQLMQEIKYQMLVVCINYAQKMSKDMLSWMAPHQKEQAMEKLRVSMMKIYESKQNVILEKHLVTKEDYGSSLLCYKADPFLAKNKAQILIMMDRAIKGEGPIFDVPEEALNVNTLENMVNIYQELCLMISTAVWKKMFECCQNDPSFDTSNDDHFKKAIRQINIYGMKIDYLQSKGYKKEWGCPNQIFLKATECHNLKNPDFKFNVRTIEKAYNKIIDTVSNNPLSLKEADIKMMFENEITIIKAEESSRKEKEKVPIPEANDIAGQVQFFLKKGMEAEKQLEKSKSAITKQQVVEKKEGQ